MASGEPISVLMVCLGNICRSPMAEAVFRHVAKENNLLDKFGVIDSAGTAGYHAGDEPDRRTQRVCRDNGVPVSHTARQVTRQDFYNFDYIFAMDKNNQRDLESMKPKDAAKSKILMFGEFGDGKALQDPYYGGESGFKVNFEQCKKSSEGFMKTVLGADI
ncbi:hypothetical protein H072_4708 [Dactylellina haptotyla CBS 200.50]|uniref:Phosphotyrosine protein phosphatase I domain-containing protein n=1 Tax=Dactylellina haptotyla (strain CBS 200.50) TaxID=1284197 RepID=S8AEF2_DACHA|nr:hypothetical protein H072_4708 [Dactylellina haptotyla CBS 200.50]